jgi:hypothetical protein
VVSEGLGSRGLKSVWGIGVVADCVYRMGQPFPLDIGMLRQITQKKTTNDS